MRIVCQQTILMKYHALFDIFEKKKQQNLKFSSAANYRWCFILHISQLKRFQHGPENVFKDIQKKL